MSVRLPWPSRYPMPQEIIDVEPAREHRQRAIGIARPLLLGPVAIKLNPVLVRIAQVERFTDAVIAGSIESNARCHHAMQRIGEGWSRRIKDGGVKQPSCSRRRGSAAFAFPGVESDVMVISARGNEGRARTHALHQFKPQHSAVKSQRSIEVSHL